MFSSINPFMPPQKSTSKPLSPLNPKSSKFGKQILNNGQNYANMAPNQQQLLKRPLSTGTENQPPTKKNHRKTTTYEQNLSPARNDVKDVKEALLFHAGMRSQLFFITCLVLWDKVEKHPGSPSKVKTKIGGATKQSGVGTRLEHAAHSNAGAGLQDNLKEVYTGQIIRHGVSEKTEKILLLAKKFPQDMIETLKKNHTDAALVKKIMDDNWPKSEPFLVDSKELSDRLNSTTKLPRDVNLLCDCVLEKKIRPEMEKLYDQVIINDLTPEAAVVQYMDLIEAHFLEEIPRLEAKLKTLTDQNAITKLKNLIFYHEAELEGTRIVDFSILRKDFETPPQTPKDAPCFDVSKTFSLFT